MAELNPAILPVRPGSISETDKLALSTIGIVVIEHEEPHTLRILRPQVDISSSDMLACAMQALCYSTGSSAVDQRDKFTKLLSTAIINARTQAKEGASHG